MLHINHPFVKRMQNPVRMKTKRRGAEKTVYGPVTHKRYRIGGNLPYTWIDQRDVKALVGITKNPGQYYYVDPDQSRDDEEEMIDAPMADKPFEEFLQQVAKPGKREKAEEAIEEKTAEDESADESDDDFPYAFDFTQLDGIGVKQMEFILDEGITTLKELREAGHDFLLSLPNVGEARAKDIMEQIGKILDD